MPTLKSAWPTLAFVLWAGLHAMPASAQDQTTGGSSAATTSPTSTTSVQPPSNAELQLRLALLEKQVSDRDELFKKLDQFFWLITGLGAVGSVLAFTALFRDSFSKRERTLAKQDIEFSRAFAKHSETAAQAQIDNLQNVSGLIKFVHDAFDLQEKQKKALEELRDQQKTNFDDQIKELKSALTAETAREAERSKDGKSKYQQVVSMMKTFEETQALEWPTLPLYLLRLADQARIALQNIPRDILAKIVSERPNEHASMLQRLGVAAYYDFYQIGIALELLGEAESLFESSASASFNKVSAYTQHFLAIIEKNWCLEGDSSGASLERAAARLRKAVTTLQNEANHFLTPVTLAEVLSYQPEVAWAEAATHLDEIGRKASARGVEHLDRYQHSLYVRSLLLRGNIEFRRSSARDQTAIPASARAEYARAVNVPPPAGLKENWKPNPYALLSTARAMESPRTPVSAAAADGVDLWRKGLDALNRSDAIRKQEMTQRVTAIAWGILAAARLGELADEQRYRHEFATSGADKKIAGRFALFFSPFAMTVVSYEELKRDLNA